MAACEPVVFEDVSPAKWAGLQAKIAAEGYTVAGDTGEASYMGVTLTWAYDATEKTLTIQCTKHPLVLPCALVNAKIKSLYENNGG